MKMKLCCRLLMKRFFSYSKYLKLKDLVSKQLHSDTSSTQKHIRASADRSKPKAKGSPNNSTYVHRHTKIQKYDGYPPSRKFVKSERSSYRQATLTVLGSGSGGTSASVAINFRKDSWYLFNEGQGLSRTDQRTRGKFQFLRNVFFTSSSWKNMSGLLHSNDHLQEDTLVEKAFDKVINVHGPASVLRCIDCKNAQSYIEVDHYVADPSKVFYDDPFICEYVLLYPKTGRNKEATETKTNEINKKHPDTLEILHEFRRDNTDEVAAYIVKPTHWKRDPKSEGRINLSKCVELGLESSSFRELLKEGFCVLPNGRVIKQEDVEYMNTAGGNNCTVLILECPSEDYFESLLTHSKFKQYQTSKTNIVDIIVHMTPHDVCSKPEYKEFMNRFGKATRHLMLNEKASPMLVSNIYNRNIKLNHVDDEVFPLLPMQGPDYSIENYLDQQIVPGQSGLIFNLVKKTFTHQYCTKGDYDPLSNTEISSSDYVELQEMRAKLQSLPEKDYAQYPELVFLGTSASRMSKCRSESCILVHTSEHSIFMLDCGEDSYAQLCQFYGDEVEDILVKIDGIFISHGHKDHKKSLYSILLARKRAFEKAGRPNKKLYILGPTVITFQIKWMQQNFESLGDSIRFISLQHTDEIKGKILHKLKFQSIVPVQVIHPGPCFGIVLHHRDGWKLVFSGDTLPCKELVEAGKDCDILIHEGTYCSNEIHKVLLTKHSTQQQAVVSGQSMGARYTIITHLTANFDALFTTEVQDRYKDNVIFAYDFMRVRPKDLPRLPIMQQPIKTMLHCYEKNSEHID